MEIWKVKATESRPFTAIVVRENDWNNGIYQDNVQKLGKNKPNMTKNYIKNSTVVETEK